MIMSPYGSLLANVITREGKIRSAPLASLIR